MRAAAGAIFVLVLAVAVPIAATFGFAREIWPRIQEGMQGQQQAGGAASYSAATQGQAEAGILSLAQAAEAYRADATVPPADVDQLYQAWSSLHPGELTPLDPYDGDRFGYRVEHGEYIIWSVGPDPADSSDNLYYSSQAVKEQ